MVSCHNHHHPQIDWNPLNSLYGDLFCYYSLLLIWGSLSEHPEPLGEPFLEAVNLTESPSEHAFY